MKKSSNQLIYSVQATLWDGKRQLVGFLELREIEILFQLMDFKESHLNLRIPLILISKVEEYLVFDIAKNGLRIIDIEGKNDLFVIDDVLKFKKLLVKALSKI